MQSAFFGQISRSFQRAQDIDDSQSITRLNEGVLELTLPKRDASASKRLMIQ